jgi:hypothetical protein
VGTSARDTYGLLDPTRLNMVHVSKLRVWLKIWGVDHLCHFRLRRSGNQDCFAMIELIHISSSSTEKTKFVHGFR